MPCCMKSRFQLHIDRLELRIAHLEEQLVCERARSRRAEDAESTRATNCTDDATVAKIQLNRFRELYDCVGLPPDNSPPS